MCCSRAGAGEGAEVYGPLLGNKEKRKNKHRGARAFQSSRMSRALCSVGVTK
jgi:hypothetical protein